MLRRALLPPLLLLLGGLLTFGASRTSLAAEDRTPASQADAFAKALAGKDAAALRALATADDPDPWLVAESLLVRGLAAEARAFAAQAAAPGTKDLPAYVAASAEVAAREGKGPVSRLRTAHEEAKALHTARSFGAARPVFDRVAKDAAALGWLTQASDAEYRSGLALYELADYSGARERFERELALEIRLGSKVGEGRGHFRVALQCMILGDEARGRTALARSLRLAQEAKDALYVSKNEAELARDHVVSGRVREGVAAYERAWAAMESYDGSSVATRYRATPTAIVYARQRALLSLASTHAQLNELETARGYARRAVRFSRKAGIERALLSARAFFASLEGAISTAQGRVSDSLGYYSRASELYERLGTPDAWAVALRRLADTRLRLADYPGALGDISRAIALLEPTGAQRPLFAAHLVAASANAMLGRTDDTARHARSAAAIAIQLGDPHLRIRALNTQAGVLRATQDPDGAVRLLHQAQAIHREHPNTDILGVEIQLGRLEYNAGDYEAALQRALRVLAKTTAYGSVLAVQDLRRLAGGCHAKLGRLDEALAEYRTIVAAVETSGQVSQHISLLTEMAGFCIRAKRPAEAMELAEKAVSIATRGRDREAEVTSRYMLGRALLWKGERERALEETLFATEIAEGLRVPVRAAALGHLAEVHYYRAEYGEAIKRAHECVDLGRRYGLSMSDEARARAQGSFAWGVRWGLAAAVDEVGHGPDLYKFLERMRAQSVVVSLGGRHRLRNVHVPEALRRAEDEARAAAALAYEAWLAQTRRPDRARRQATRQAYELALEKERDAVAAAKDAVRKAARLDDAGYGEGLSFGGASALCGKHDALVLYGDDGMDYVAMVLVPGRYWQVRLGRSRAVDAAMAAVLADPNDGKASARLRTLIYAPLKLPSTVTRVVASPAGTMAYVPFAALDPTRSFAMVPSATAWAALRAQPVDAGSKILALADPAYERKRAGLPTLQTTLRGRVFAPLPASRLEAEGIGSHTRLLGAEATETQLRAILAKRGRWKSIHLACHGVVDDLNPARSALVLASDEHNDGFLHANEIHEQVHLSTELVVLSACETGRGRIYQGEGLLGLSRAFMLAGAPRALCSLWKVDDEATSALMVKFYEAWNPPPGSDGKPKAGVSAAQALQRAQAYVRSQKKWAAPNYWAGWTLWGLAD